MIYPVDSTIHLLNNWDLVSHWLFWDIEKHPGHPVQSRWGMGKGPLIINKYML